MNNENEQKLVNISQEIKSKQIAAIKDVVRLTFEHLQSLEKMRNILQEQIKILKFDLVDLKEGRLDRINERQSMNEACKGISILKVSKDEEEKGNNPWYINYGITFSLDGVPISIYINNSITKMHASGSYKLKDGSIKYL